MKIEMNKVPDAWMEAGTHTVTILDVVDGWSGSDPKLEITMENTDGATFRKTFTLSQKAGMFFKRFAVAAGFPRDSEYDSQDLIGRRLNITLAPRDYINSRGEAKQSLEIVSQSPAGSAPPHIAPAPAHPRQAAPPQTTTPPRRAPAESRAPAQEYFADGSPVPADPEDDGLPF